MFACLDAIWAFQIRLQIMVAAFASRDNRLFVPSGLFDKLQPSNQTPKSMAVEYHIRILQAPHASHRPNPKVQQRLHERNLKPVKQDSDIPRNKLSLPKP
jgi:hypothetical protein